MQWSVVNDLRRPLRYLISWRHAQWKFVYRVRVLPLLYAPAVTLHSMRITFTFIMLIDMSDCHLRSRNIHFDKNSSSDTMFTLNYKWVDELPRLVSIYNARKHRHTTRRQKITPAIAERLLDTVYSAIKITAKFKVSDSVHVSKYKTIFEKGYAKLNHRVD